MKRTMGPTIDRRRALAWLLAGFVMGAARAGDEPEPKPPADKPAVLESCTVETDDDDQVLRLLLTLSYPKTTVTGEFAGQGAYLVTLPLTKPDEGLGERLAVAKEAVSDVLFKPVGEALVVHVRLNTPVNCRVYAKPSEKQVIIECAYPVQPPEFQTPPNPDAPLTTEFVETDIRVILEALATQSGANLLFLPGVEGTYSLSLRQVTLTQALDALWEAWGLVWKKLPGPIYLVGPDDKLGDSLCDDDLRPPPGWTSPQAWQAASAEFPGLRLTRDLATVGQTGPLPVRGTVREVGQARRWLGTLLPLPEGVEPAPERLGPSSQATTEYYPRQAVVADLKADLERQFPAVKVTLDEALGRLTVSGPRDQVAAARTWLKGADQAADKIVEEPLWLPLIPADRVPGLSEKSGVDIEVVYDGPEGCLVYAHGPESKIEGLRQLAEKLREWTTRRDREQQQSQQRRPAGFNRGEDSTGG